MELKNYYSPQQAITFLQDNGNPNFDEHDLTMLVIDGILNPLFLFQGVLAYSFVPSYADSNNYPETKFSKLDILLNFTGFISPYENDIAFNISKTHTPYSTYFLKVKAIEIKEMSPLIDEHEVEFYDYHEANIQIGRVDCNETIFQLSCVGNPLFEDDLGIRFSSDECRFSLVELKKLLDTLPEVDTNFIEELEDKATNYKNQASIYENSDQIVARVKEEISNQNRVKALKRNEPNKVKNAKAIELWEQNRRASYALFAAEFYNEINISYDTLARWIGKYERDKKNKTHNVDY